ncbi:MAG TPA: FAD/NAD(P)-binding protein [Steroidobacteraceae bacterium]|nr:FAD/NAD(P)-binding protein [Steroidobacteraceae bacterium]
MNYTIAIVGGGFCGTVLAANLLRRPRPDATDIVLIERSAAVGRGVAYAAREFPYLLNVPAARLSADARDPLQFLRFAQRHRPDADGEDFLPRALYGDYLQEVLSQAERAAAPHTRLLRIMGEVRHITPRGGDGPFAAEFTDRPAVIADRMILAPGNPPPPLLPWAEAVRQHSAYRHDPWDLPENLGAEHSVLIVGNGLTMADAALVLSQDAMRTPVLHTISRRGLIPKPQTTFSPAAVRGEEEALLACAHSMRRVLAMTRQLTREVENRGGDWREVVTFIRHLAPALWRRLPLAERRRFVRHLQAHWDTHRHRLPPQLAARIAALRRGGKLQVNAGRIDSVTAAGEKLRVSWRPRGGAGGGGASAALTVDLLVNAMGPDYALARCADPLLNSLRAAGLVSEDALGLGLRTARYGACVDAQGVASRRLFYLGPMLRADHWEATAATELRDHAEQLAAHLAGEGRES